MSSFARAKISASDAPFFIIFITSSWWSRSVSSWNPAVGEYLGAFVCLTGHLVSVRCSVCLTALEARRWKLVEQSEREKNCHRQRIATIQRPQCRFRHIALVAHRRGIRRRNNTVDTRGKRMLVKSSKDAIFFLRWGRRSNLLPRKRGFLFLVSVGAVRGGGGSRINGGVGIACGEAGSGSRIGVLDSVVVLLFRSRP